MSNRSWERERRAVVCPACTGRFEAPFLLRIHLRVEHRLSRREVSDRLRTAVGMPPNRNGYHPGVRKVGFVGHSSLGMTLPSAWCRRNGVGVGAYLRVDEIEGGSTLLVRKEDAPR